MPLLQIAYPGRAAVQHQQRLNSGLVSDPLMRESPKFTMGAALILGLAGRFTQN